MSEILSNIVVEQTSINFSPNNNNLNVTPEAIQLNIFTGAAPGAGQSSNGELLYNNINLIDGVPNTSFANGNLTLGNVANIKITGGTNGYVLQTDGAGTLSWAVGTGNITGNGVPGGSVNQIQYNKDGANFGGSAGFTFDPSSNIVAMPGNLNVAGNIIGTVANANYANFAGEVINSAQSNITSVGTLTSLAVAGNVNITATTSIQQAIEKVTSNATSSAGTVNFDLLNQAILYKTGNATANFTINIRGNSSTQLNSILSSNQSITCTYLNTTGASGFYANTIQIDGNTIVPKWIVNGIPNSGTISGIDSYTFNIIKTAAYTYTVLGTKVGFQ